MENLVNFEVKIPSKYKRIITINGRKSKGYY